MSGGANTPGGMNPSPTGGTLTGFDVKLRRGQDPSLRCKRHMGGNGKVAGRACPAPTDCCFRNRGFGGAWRRTTSAASLLRKHARAVVCPAGANIAHTPVSLRSTVAPVRNPATPPYDVKDKGDAKRNRELTQGCGPGMPGPYGVAWTGGRREGRGRAAARPICSGRRLPVDEWHSKVAGRACPAPTDCCFRQRGFGGTPDSKVEEGPTALRTDSNTATV